MKTMIALRAASMVFTLGIGSAYAAEGDGQLFTSVQAQHSVSVGSQQKAPLFTLGGAEVRVWAPVAPPYNAEANGNLAARDIWGAG
jgi:hypothetical protein